MAKAHKPLVALGFLSLLFATQREARAVNNISWDGQGGDNNWATATNWVGDVLPGSADTALLYGNISINISSAVPTANVNIRDGGYNTTLNVLEGGNFTAATATYVAFQNGMRGRLNVLGGVLNAKALSVAGGVAGTTALFSELNISGGTTTWTSASLGTGLATNGEARISVTGTWIGSITGGSLAMGPRGELKFVLGASGVNPINLTNALNIDAASLLKVDVTACTNTNAPITLVNAASLGGMFQANNITIIGGTADTSVAQNAATGDITVSFVKALDPITAALQKVAALGGLTNAPGVYEAFVGGLQTGDLTNATTASLAPGDLKKIFYDTLPYDKDTNAATPRANTRSFAWVGIPASAATNPVPAVVLLHGGGGTAFVDWVKEWNARGYAAISMSVEGNTDEIIASTNDPAYGGDNLVGSWKPHAMSGPKRTGIYGDTSKELEDQWMYHATADTILANSLLRSLPFVDARKIGVMGVSWGGVIASTVIGIDSRFAFGIPVYGCGHKFDIPNQYGGALANNETYKKVWDPMLRMSKVTMPVLWMSWPTEMNFSLDAQAYTYLAGTNSKRVVSLIPGMLHGHAQAYDRPDTYDFAESVLSNNGTPWIQQQSASRSGNTVTAVFKSTKPLTSAKLTYTTGTGHTGTLTWPEIDLAAPVEGPAGTWTATGTLPANATGWFVNVRALGTPGPPGFEYYGGGASLVTELYASTDYHEEITVDAGSAGGLTIGHPIGQDKSTATTEVGFTGPTNVEIIAVRFENATHPDAFSHLMTLPWVLSTPLPIRSLFTVQFDNSKANLTDGQTETATMVLVWEKLDGSTGETRVPVSVTAGVPANIVYSSNGVWSSKITRPIDNISVQSGATVDLDQDAVVTTLTVTNGTLQIPPAGRTLSTSGKLTVSSGGTLNLSGGTLSPNVNAVTVDGTLRINGGTFTRSITGINPTFNGTGMLLLESGTFSLTGGGMRVLNGSNVYDSTTLGGTVEVRGGTLSIEGGGFQHVTGTLRVVGTGATIKLTSTTAGSTGTFSFVLGASGVSPVDYAGPGNLQNASLQIDGSAYTGGPATIDLIKTTNLAGVVATGKITVTGFAGKGLTATVEQDQTTTEDVRLVITRNQFGDWSNGFGLTGSNSFASADPDHDSVINALEYALGRNPNNPADAGGLPEIVPPAPGGNYVFRYIRRRDAAARGLTYTVLRTIDLSSGPWTTNGVTETGASTLDANFEEVSNTSSAATNAFFKLKVDLAN